MPPLAHTLNLIVPAVFCIQWAPCLSLSVPSSQASPGVAFVYGFHMLKVFACPLL